MTRLIRRESGRDRERGDGAEEIHEPVLAPEAPCGALATFDCRPQSRCLLGTQLLGLQDAVAESVEGREEPFTLLRAERRVRQSLAGFEQPLLFCGLCPEVGTAVLSNAAQPLTRFFEYRVPRDVFPLFVGAILSRRAVDRPGTVPIDVTGRVSRYQRERKNL